MFSLRGMFSTLGSCIEEVDSIVEDATEIKKILEMKKDIVGSLVTTSSPTGAPSGKDTAKVGLDTDLIQIKERLVRRSRELDIIPIVGMGGIGKTTLARTVYEDPLTVTHFDFRIWVTISQEYNTQRILRAILSVSDTNPDKVTKNDVGPLIECVYKSLIGWRFLIVLDDMWDAKAWDRVKNALPDDKKGSRVILMTRLLEVAAQVDSSSPLHQMQLLNEYQSWALFQKEVFGQQTCPPRLEKMGKIITRNCKGLPLAIVVIAGFLKINFTKHYWENFAKSINESAAATHDNQLFRILSMSYDNLPPHLKACFLYMSIFPEDHEIPSKKLIWIWVAEGFLKPKRDKSMEEAAEAYLVDLVERNLITIRKKSSNGRIRTCGIHDALRELSLRKAKEEKFCLHFIRKDTDETSSTLNCFQQYLRSRFRSKTNSSIVYLRRLGVNTDADTFALVWNINTETARTLIFSHPEYVPPAFLEAYRLLRVLDALQIHFRCDHDNVLCSLVYLRYLALAYECRESGGVHLKLLQNLKNLETLIVKHECHSYIEGLGITFPILDLPKLRHFVLIRNDFLIPVCYRI